MRILTALVVAIFASTFSNVALAECDPDGIGDATPGTIAAHMNPYKNRTTEIDQPQDIRIADILGYSEREDESREKESVTLKGQLLGYKHERPETPNCHSDTRKDYHIWIGAMTDDHANGDPLSAGDVKDLKTESVVVELTPNIQDEHPDWASRLSSLKGKYVCIEGWLFFDHDHPDQVGKTRGTQWEVHPIMGIGLLQADGSCKMWT